MMCSLSAERYLLQVRRALPCKQRMKRRLMPQIRQELGSYLESRPDASYRDLTERFGRPEQIAASYVESADTGELLAGMRYGNRVVKIVAIALLIALIIWAIGITIAVIDGMKSSHGYYVEYITVIDQTEYTEYTENTEMTEGDWTP